MPDRLGRVVSVLAEQLRRKRASFADPEWRRAAIDPLLAACVSTLLALVYYRDWVPRFGVPLEIGGDAADKLAKVVSSIRHGWLFYDPSSGLPGVAQRLDFPRFDSLNYAAIKLVAAIVGDPIVAVNAFVLGGFGAIAASACWVLERMGIGRAWALATAVLYAWLPYHQLRGLSHFTNGFYALVPLGLWLIWGTWYASNERRPRWLAVVTLCAALELQNPYYGLFFALLLASCGSLLALTRGFRASLPALLRSTAMLGVIVTTFAIEQTPRLLYEREHGKNLLALIRPPFGPSEFALSLADLLNPSPDHPVGPLRWFTERAWSAVVGLSTERTTASLPWFGFLGLFVAVASIIRNQRDSTVREPNAPLMRWAALTTGLALLWAHQGALCTVLAEFGLVSVRGWNRMSVWIAFCAYAAAAAWLDERTRAFGPIARGLAIGALALPLMGERLLALPRASFTNVASRMQDARSFANTLSGDGVPRRVFVLPYLPYPEAGTRLGVPDYAHFILPIVDQRLSVSYGSMRGRGAYYYSDAVGRLSGGPLVDYLKLGGFDTVVVDGAMTGAPRLTEELEAALGAPKARTRQYVAFELAEPRPSAPSTCGFRSYELGAVLDLAGDPTARRFLELNFSDFEASGTWTLGKLAALRVCLPNALPRRMVMELTGNLFEPRPGPQSAGVFFDGHPVCTLTLLTSAGRDPSRWRCEFAPSEAASIEHEVRFVIASPATPKSLKLGTDERELGLLLTSLRFSDAADPSEP